MHLHNVEGVCDLDFDQVTSNQFGSTKFHGDCMYLIEKTYIKAVSIHHLEKVTGPTPTAMWLKVTRP